ncbi:Hyaluronan synthase [Candidatus Ornithobacterium hominis]|uniref:glycosyltransferase n=1 Tax=Candidatus Ornithobacterium hominis TaxID=2497989 RepID=UPI0024BD08F5|nr:glycosyltransferase [Candidatus Ornithobacterium hominis]CAI9430272.1 Hyaluronan synthase [Candidatus Ornithobacterium hominis]
MLLSIIIPVYNADSFLQENFKRIEKLYDLLKSEEFEIIYVNDGSTDNSAKILQGLKNSKNNIQVFHQENQGSSGARNSGTDIAKGQYIQYLDSDDYVDFKKIIPLLHFAIEKNLDALSYRLDIRNTHNKLISEGIKHPVIFDKIITGKQAIIQGYIPSSICVFLFKRSFLNQNQLRITPNITHMDVEFTSRMMLVCERIIFKDIAAYHYLRRDGSITKPITKEKKEKLLIDEVFVAKVIKNTIQPDFSKELKIAIEKNYNSVTWNLFWNFYKNPYQVDSKFKKKRVDELIQADLYPIKGALKTPFQNFSRYLMNQPFILKKFILK